jgi:hypothetical protein
MTITVEFPGVEPQWVFDHDSISFFAKVNGRTIPCLATGELLIERFGAKGMTGREAMRAFKEHRSELEDLAMAQIILDRVPQDGVVVLRPETLALKDVAYSDAVQKSSDFPAIDRATGFLSDILSTSAVHMSATWDRVEEDGRVYYTLQLHGLGREASAAIPREEIHRPGQVYVWLARWWGNVLQQESHRLLRKLNEPGQSEN